jgi:hypothetical protein
VGAGTLPAASKQQDGASPVPRKPPAPVQAELLQHTMVAMSGMGTALPLTASGLPANSWASHCPCRRNRGPE